MTEKIKVSLNVDDLTFEELEEFEDLTGLVMSEAIASVIVRDRQGRPVPDPDDEKGRPLRETRISSKTMGCLTYLALKRDNPDITYAEVRKMKMTDIDFEVLESADDDEGKDE